jgi:hypothetical protein
MQGRASPLGLDANRAARAACDRRPFIAAGRQAATRGRTTRETSLRQPGEMRSLRPNGDPPLDRDAVRGRHP